eukprot:CAMPEP_0183608074 /NCGR_PEP_ID=MMETSP0371-20130417/183777_1 /TAXON_ID=268820 /ORGANISM="Peridinium aciculiferum, Strain PAER-2" /LENGTH=161 /DNA_ID=CAMNT_0025820197 /DNA_START=219 /DNA_END=704 /DNA_ORIENTATION=-
MPCKLGKVSSGASSALTTTHPRTGRGTRAGSAALGRAPSLQSHQPPLIQAPDVERVPAVQHSAGLPLCKVVQADHAQLSGEALRSRAEPLEELPTLVVRHVLPLRRRLPSVEADGYDRAHRDTCKEPRGQDGYIAVLLVIRNVGNDEGDVHRKQRRNGHDD